MIVEEIVVVENTIEIEIVLLGTIVVEVDRMGYFQNYYLSNLVYKVDFYFQWGTKVLEYSMLVHYLLKVLKNK